MACKLSTLLCSIWLMPLLVYSGVVSAQEIVNQTAGEARNIRVESQRHDLQEGTISAADQQSLRFKGGDDHSDAAFPGSYGILLLLLGIMAGGLILLRKKMLGIATANLSAGGRIEVCDRRRLSVHTYVTLIKIDEQTYVVAESAQGVALHRVEDIGQHRE